MTWIDLQKMTLFKDNISKMSYDSYQAGAFRIAIAFNDLYPEYFCAHVRNESNIVKKNRHK